MTFKMFIAKLNDDVNRRLFNEMSVISDAFEERGALGNVAMYRLIYYQINWHRFR